MWGASLVIKDFTFIFFDTQSQLESSLNIAGLVLAGIFVGIGTRLGNGCTSGHSICGIPRFSVRSIVGTVLFMSSAIAIATIRFYVPFLNQGNRFDYEFTS
jgi:uncharacterized membrane protein YedE/YeeE